jgi:hypothetical protein
MAEEAEPPRQGGQYEDPVGSYKLPLSQYMCIGLVVACSFQQKYDFSQVLLRPAHIVSTPVHQGHVCVGVFLGAFYECGVAQCYVGSVSSNMHW